MLSKLQSEIGNIKLVVVTKSRSVQEIKNIVNKGSKIVAENRIQEAESKYFELKDYFEQNNIKYHFIGHLQSNKAKKAVEMFDLIQSVDSIRLAKKINNAANNIDKIQDILLQVNVGNESQKFGFMQEKIEQAIKELSTLKNIKIHGLMCMAPYYNNSEQTRPYFRKMKQLFDTSKLKTLSMGMTNDYKVAIEEGSTMIRIGRLIFGKY